MDHHLGKSLRQELEKRGLSPSQFAELSGIHRSVVSSILTGNRRPGPKLWAQIQAALRLAPEDASRLWAEASAGSQRLTALRNISVSLSPINVDHPAVAELVARHFGEKVESIRGQKPGFEMIEVEPGPVRSFICVPRPASASEAESQGQQVVSTYDLVISCSSGANIAVAVRGFRLVAVKIQENARVPAPEDLFEVIKAGGVMFLPVAITSLEDLARLLK